ncbi:MAG: NUDIX domain-containing protein [Propionibacterium sp.]|nr:NUDIX domain-containing protein [Propionibacterium sp.]
MSDTPPADLGEEWQPGPDGIPYRAAARVLVLDAEGSILLLEGHDDNDLDHRWWFTIGGGIATGEDARTAAGRELAEESGFVVDPAELIGPVATRSALFEFVRHTVRQDEEFFLWRTDRIRPAIATAGWTDLEQRLLDQARWFSAAELADLIGAGHTVYPIDLPDLLGALQPWDGRVRVLEEQN